MGTERGDAADPDSDRRAALLEAVTGWIRQAEQRGDLALVLQPQAVEDARRLAALYYDGLDDLYFFYVLGWFHWYRFSSLPEGQGDADLEAAIEMFIPCYVAGARAEGLPKRLLPILSRRVTTLYLKNAATVLKSRFRRTRPKTDQDQRIAISRMADRATEMLRQALVSTDPELLAATVELWNQVLAAAPTDHPRRTGWLSNLGLALVERHTYTGELTDLTAAIDCYRQAVAAAPTHDPDRTAALGNLGIALLRQFERTGEPTDLTAAIDCCRQALAASYAEDPARATYLVNAGNALYARFLRVGAQTDLDEAIDHYREAVVTTPNDDPDLAGWLSCLGGTLLTRYQRAGALADLDQSITYLEEAVATTPTDHPNRAPHLSNLGSALQSRAQRATDLANTRRDLNPADDASEVERTTARRDVDAAIAHLREAVSLTPDGHPNRAGYLANLGDALRVRFECTAELADVDEAVGHATQAVAALGADHPSRAERLVDLGEILQARFERTREPEDRDDAIAVFQEAAEVGAATPSIRIRAAHKAGKLAAKQRPQQAAKLLEHAVRLLPQLVPWELARTDREYAVKKHFQLAIDAAALALDDPSTPIDERAGRALGLLEAGRAALLNQALHIRSDTRDLAIEHPGLADRFTRLRDLLDTTTPLVRVDADPGASSEFNHAAQDRHRLARDFADVLAHIRAQPGFASFALPPSPDQLLAEAAHGPVAVINISEYRSDALLVTTAGISCLPLPQLTYAAVFNAVGTFQRAVTVAGTARTFPERTAAQQQLTRILEWLWDNAAGPVLDALGYRTRPAPAQPQPRLWWVPGGLLGLLPIHAAGYHATRADSIPRTVMDRVVSSHSPTVGALSRARKHLAGTESAGVERALIVAMPTTPGLTADLRYAYTEAEALAARLPRSVQLTEPDPATAAGATVDLAHSVPSKTAVVDLLATCPIAHFACHGTSDRLDPWQSRLLLHDHTTDPFTVATLASLHLDHARLAYLSACETALTSSEVRLLDEAIHLASAFQLAGFPHVIGTLWVVNDRISATIADAFYAGITVTGDDGPALLVGRAARALHDAVRSARDDRPDAPSLWAAYLHAGA